MTDQRPRSGGIFLVEGPTDSMRHLFDRLRELSRDQGGLPIIGMISKEDVERAGREGQGEAVPTLAGMISSREVELARRKVLDEAVAQLIVSPPTFALPLGPGPRKRSRRRRRVKR